MRRCVQRIPRGPHAKNFPQKCRENNFCASQNGAENRFSRRRKISAKRSMCECDFCPEPSSSLLNHVQSYIHNAQLHNRHTSLSPLASFTSRHLASADLLHFQRDTQTGLGRRRDTDFACTLSFFSSSLRQTPRGSHTSLSRSLQATQNKRRLSRIFRLGKRCAIELFIVPCFTSSSLLFFFVALFRA